MAKFVSKENLAYYHSKIKTPLNFAQEEYNKSLNEFNINSLISSTSNACTSTISNGAINTVATGNYAYKLYYMRGLEIGKTYSISFKAIKAGSSESQVFIGNEVNVDSFTYARKWLSTTKNTFIITFTATTNILSITTYVAFGDYVSGASATLSEIMLNEGSEALPYQEYNGEIVHKGDLGETVWEGSLLHGGSMSIDLSQYEYIECYDIGGRCAKRKLFKYSINWFSINYTNVADRVDYRDVVVVKYDDNAKTLNVWGYEGQTEVPSFGISMIRGYKL